MDVSDELDHCGAQSSKVIRSFMNQSHYVRYDEYMSESKLKNLWAFTVAIFAVGGCIGE